jgi:hypothetical protein
MAVDGRIAAQESRVDSPVDAAPTAMPAMHSDDPKLTMAVSMA